MRSSSGRCVSRVLLAGATLIAIATAGGCGGGKAAVTGEVKYNGKPVPSGTITFLGQGGHKDIASADIVDGRYSMPSVDPGPVKVTVVTPRPSKGGQPPHGKAIETPDAAKAAKRYMPVPPRFANPDQSGINFEVKSGTQTKDFDLPK